MTLIRITYISIGNLLVVTPLKKLFLLAPATINYLQILREEGSPLTSLSMTEC